MKFCHEETGNYGIKTQQRGELAGSTHGTCVTTSKETTIKMQTTTTPSVGVEDGELVQRLLEDRNVWTVCGNHKVFCRGKIVIGPVRSWWWILQIHTMIVTIVFLLESDKYGSKIVTIAGGILFLICFLSSWKSLLCDPGIVKRPPFEQALINARKAERVFRSGQPYPTETREVRGRDQIWVFCVECQVFRPPKAGHCHVCNCCVEQMDHHCPIVGVCVGRRNLISFHVMALSLVLYHIFLLIASFSAVAMYVKKSELENPPWWSASWTLNLTIIGTLLCCTLPWILSTCECENEPPHRRAISRWSYMPPRPQSPSGARKNECNRDSEWTTCDTDESDMNANP